MEKHDFLILGRCPLDDIPLEILKGVTLEDARRVASAWQPSAVLEIADQLFGEDDRHLLGISIIRFGTDGIAEEEYDPTPDPVREVVDDE